MAVVTEIREQVHNADRRSVFLDGEYAFSMAVDEILEHGIAVGQEITAEQMSLLSESLELRRARDAMLRLLSSRPRSEGELRTRLRQKKFEEAVIDAAVADLRRLGYVDDRQFAGAWVQGRLAGRGAGRTRLAQELRARGVDRQIVDESLAGISEETEAYRALDKAQRRQQRLRDEEPEAQRRKLASFLQRRGFSYETIDQVLRSVLPPE